MKIIDHPFDLAELNREADELLAGSDKIRGVKNLNKFARVPQPKADAIVDLLTPHYGGKRYDWGFDYFYSGEPVGPHTDCDVVPWDDKVSCQVVSGCLIPLEWNCKQPYTIGYNRFEEEPRKLMRREGKMRYTDTNEEVIYQDKGIQDPVSEKYNPPGTFYHSMFGDLWVRDIYEWKLGTILLFDVHQWHSSSWFLSTDKIPDVSTEYKKMIVGFGSIDVPRN